VVPGETTSHYQGDDEGYNILVTPCYAAGTLGAPTQHLLTDEADDIIHYDTAQAAQAAIDALEEGTYYLSHGEQGRPGYEVVPSDDLVDTHCVSSDYYDGTYERIDLEDVPEEIRDALEYANVEYRHEADDLAYYDDCITHGDRTYWVGYAVRTVALQAANGQLDMIDWDNASYWVED
jgi:hypothetical protein